MNKIKALLFLSILCCSINAQIDIEVFDIPSSEQRFIQSNDKKIRLFSIPTSEDGEPDYIHEIEYDVAPGKTRTTALNDYRSLSFNADDFPALIIDTIYHVHRNTYLLEGISGDKYCLMGVDVGRGIAKDAYVFQDQDAHEPVCFISISVDTTQYAIGEIKAQLFGNEIRLPEWKDSIFSGDYISLYFNGVHYEDASSYAETVSKTQEDKEIIVRIYFKDEDNKRRQTELFSRQSYSVIIDAVTQKDKLTSPTSLKIESDSKDEHFQGKRFNVKMPLKPINDMVFIEGLDSYHFPIISQRKFLKKLRKVMYSAGREAAFPYEWLRYSAVIFNRPINDKEWHHVRWALEVDGELRLLEGEQWQGPQIDLQMQEEWLDKTIRVIPYIEGNPINYKVAIATTVIPYRK